MILDKLHPEQAVEAFDVPQSVSYNWTYDATRPRLNRLYENAKRDQWNATERLDWSIDVDPESELVPDMGIGIYGTPVWERLDARQRQRRRFEDLGILQCESNTTSDVDQDMEEERRVRAGEIEASAAA